MSEQKYSPSVILADLSESFNQDAHRSYECGWRMQEAFKYWKHAKPYDEHLVYCLEGIAWRFESLAHKIRNMDKSEIKKGEK